jgi:hypothetical protein
MNVKYCKQNQQRNGQPPTPQKGGDEPPDTQFWRIGHDERTSDDDAKPTTTTTKKQKNQAYSPKIHPRKKAPNNDTKQKAS